MAAGAAVKAEWGAGGAQVRMAGCTAGVHEAKSLRVGGE